MIRLPGAFRALASHPSAAAGCVLLATIVFAAIFGPLLAPFDPLQMDYRAILSPPSLEHPFGTDQYGRDVFSRMLYGARVSLFVGSSVVIATGIFGVAFGLLAGYIRQVDLILMRVMDGMMAFPALLLALAIAAAMGPRIENVIIALAIAYIPRTTRIVRSSVLVTKKALYIEAAQVGGEGAISIMAKHILPNSLTPLVVNLSFVFAYSILAEAALSFLGVGPPPPAPTLGNAASEGRQFLTEAPWVSLFPGLAISILVLALNLVGDGVRDFLDPRTNSGRT